MKGFTRLRQLAAETEAAGARLDALRPRFDRLRDRHTNGAAPQAVTAWQLFQTPPDLARRLVAVLDPRPGARVLEPSAGLGRLLDALAAFASPSPCLRVSASSRPPETVAVEIAPDCARVLFEQNRPGVTLKQRDFLACTPAELGLFDFVAMNPPFHRGDDVRHILHARQFLAPGGRIAALCFDTPARETQLRPLCATWEKIPAGTFAKEGTRVPTVLLTIQG
jgi:SAM-dependent methyltransferase